MKKAKSRYSQKVTPKALIGAYKTSQSQQYIQEMLHTTDSSKAVTKVISQAK